jgi:ComF family protein
LPALARELADSLFSVIFPSSCPLCSQELYEAGLTGVCRACWESLAPWNGPACAQCGLPFTSERALDAEPAVCALCRNEAFDFDRARSYGLYGGNLRAAILQLKFQRRERLGRRLGALMAPSWRDLEDSGAGEAAVLVPVPLHSTRERERGFNQAELLARGLSAMLARSRNTLAPRVEPRALRRTRATPPQTGLSLSARRENVRGVFAVSDPARVRDLVIVLVDDVMTTGATLSACASALKGAGAAAVLALTLARATPEFGDFVAGSKSAGVDDFAPPHP